MFGFLKRNKKIRKDVGELNAADLAYAPFWSFCLDEESVEEQTECTVKPMWPTAPLVWPHTDGGVVCDYTARRGDKLIGLIFPRSEDGFEGPYAANPCLMLPRPLGQFFSHPYLEKYNGVLADYSARVELRWPSADGSPETSRRVLADLAYRAIGLTAEELFPLQCRPRVALAKWPESFEIPGFMQRPGKAGDTFR
jgi:hypothetical protein